MEFAASVLSTTVIVCVCVWCHHETALMCIQNVYYTGSCVGEKNALADLIVFEGDGHICRRTPRFDHISKDVIMMLYSIHRHF